jgi:hypothetical protein
MYELWHNENWSYVINMARIIRRTTIVIPEPLKKRAMAQARRERISFSELLRRSLERALPCSGKRSARKDPFWSDIARFDGPVPPDMSINHDKYLYDEPES